jgi:hypothetical protein
MQVIMDLRAKSVAFTLSHTQKSASVICEFSGRFKSENTIEIELVVTKQTSFGRPIDLYVQELNQIISAGRLLRANGQLERLAYQEREGGREVDKLRMIAYQLDESNEAEPIFSVAAVQGYVGLPLNAAFYKEDGGRCNANFILSAAPESGQDKEAYLSIFVSAFGEIAQQVRKMKVKEKSYVLASGRLMAGANAELLMLKLRDITFAKFPVKRKEADDGK